MKFYLTKPLRIYNKIKIFFIQEEAKLSRALKRLKKGFTLIEIAIVILVLSILFVVLFGVNFTVSKISKNSSHIAQKRTQVIHVLNMIQSSIRLVYYYPEQYKTVFFGKSNGIENSRSDQVTFTSILPGSELSGGGTVGEVSYYLKKDNIMDTGKLYRREENIVDESPYSGGAHYLLLDNVVSFHIQYSINGVDWQDNWSSRTTRRIPRMIKTKIIVKIAGKEEIFETLSIPGVYLK